jgi:hypothetical protein
MDVKETEWRTEDNIKWILREQCVVDRIILKWMLREQSRSVGEISCGYAQGLLVSSCKRSNQLPGSTKGGGYLH